MTQCEGMKLCSDFINKTLPEMTANCKYKNVLSELRVKVGLPGGEKKETKFSVKKDDDLHLKK